MCVQEDIGLLQFTANAAQPLNPDTCNAMLVDEVSMLDLPLAAALLSAISPRDFFQLVLVGQQLSADLHSLLELNLLQFSDGNWSLS